MEARSGTLCVSFVRSHFWPPLRPHHSLLEGRFLKEPGEHPNVVWTPPSRQARQYRIVSTSHSPPPTSSPSTKSNCRSLLAKNCNSPLAHLNRRKRLVFVACTQQIRVKFLARHLSSPRWYFPDGRQTTQNLFFPLPRSPILDRETKAPKGFQYYFRIADFAYVL